MQSVEFERGMLFEYNMEEEKLKQLLDAIEQDDIASVQTWFDKNMPNHQVNANKVTIDNTQEDAPFFIVLCFRVLI